MKLPLIRKSLIKEQELQLAFASDVVFACSNYLADYLKNVNQKTYYLPSAVEKRLFEKEFLSEPEICDELERPIFLMIANFDERIDTDLIIKISDKFQDSSIVLLGGAKKDVIKKLSEKKNIIFLNYIKRDDIANYINYSDICFIAYKRNEFINGISPIKLYEYLAFGKPVVTTYFPETEFFEDLIYVSNTDEEFISNIDRALDEDIETYAPKRINFAQRNTWNARLKEINGFLSGCFGKN
jgi:glycosyltransferase involved in cell wall biosynthesis